MTSLQHNKFIVYNAPGGVHNEKKRTLGSLIEGPEIVVVCRRDDYDHPSSWGLGLSRLVCA